MWLDRQEALLRGEAPQDQPATDAPQGQPVCPTLPLADQDQEMPPHAAAAASGTQVDSPVGTQEEDRQRAMWELSDDDMPLSMLQHQFAQPVLPPGDGNDGQDDALLVDDATMDDSQDFALLGAIANDHYDEFRVLRRIASDP